MALRNHVLDWSMKEIGKIFYERINRHKIHEY